MEITLKAPDYNPASGMTLSWVNGFEIKVTVVDNSVVIVSNREGLLSLANHLLNLSQETVPGGHHLHFDESNSLSENSAELIIEKT